MPTAALSDAELRARYDALGKLEDWPGERTFVSRCLTFDDFVAFGPMVAEDFATLRDRNPDAFPDAIEPHPGLAALVEAAWPGVAPRPR